jgi:menaquinone-dependent protoporphyrinogen oxidase
MNPDTQGGAAMYDVPVFFATTEGQTQRIAEHVAAALRAAGLGSVAMEVTSVAAQSFDWADARGVVLAASLHAGQHQRTATQFASRNLAHLNGVPSLFVSVSLSAASRQVEERREAERIAQAFATSAGWSPTRIACVAGALAYTKYSLLKRWFMKRIARKEGGPTDTSRDHDLTDWRALAVLSSEFAQSVREASGMSVSA